MIFAAEDHLNPLHHVMQLEMIKAVDALDERPFAIGLEMFYRQHQPALDAFVFEDGSFANLKRRTRWKSTWGATPIMRTLVRRPGRSLPLHSAICGPLSIS